MSIQQANKAVNPVKHLISSEREKERDIHKQDHVRKQPIKTDKRHHVLTSVTAVPVVEKTALGTELYREGKDNLLRGQSSEIVQNALSLPARPHPAAM